MSVSRFAITLPVNTTRPVRSARRAYVDRELKNTKRKYANDRDAVREIAKAEAGRQ